ncbi:MAG TPA: hypothetical protein VIU61_25375 [Kofleriaceae bacterium]
MVRWLALALLATGCSNTPPTTRTPVAAAGSPVTAVTATQVTEPARAPAPTPPPAMPTLTRETFDEVVEDSFEAVFETCIASRPAKSGDHSVEVTVVLHADRDPEIEAPVAWPVADPTLEDCLVDQLVQLELPAFPITDNLEYSYKIKERADGSRVRIFSTMVILPPTTQQSS